jgi:hypothetical protein
MVSDRLWRPFPRKPAPTIWSLGSVIHELLSGGWISHKHLAPSAL